MTIASSPHQTQAHCLLKLFSWLPQYCCSTPLWAPFFSQLLRPAWTWVLTCPGPQTLFSQVCMSQGNWDLWVLKHLSPTPIPPHDHSPNFAPLILIFGDLRAATQLEVWALACTQGFNLVPSSGLMFLHVFYELTLQLWALTLPWPACHRHTAKLAEALKSVSSCLSPKFAAAICVSPDSNESQI